ncbi:hypothetical protein SAMN05421504_11597 [Amycolatopsis xylanica]|uniref:Uncharacterized protein n=1 Tax=Amycolatopsis xylanica TaxID=589385 RepID=A0A1H3STZ3_9PSEU|nr:hypothetical protein [Amycolatopsis xylanica]SDZ41011.1 hypothetical protein SAMN05421504_11597 [Amycolatopsis xylanica]
MGHRLANRITTHDQAWVSLRDIGLSRDEADAIVAEYGKQVVWQCTDHTDQLLLIADPGHLPTRKSRWFKPRVVLRYVVPVLYVAIGTAAFITMAQLSYAVYGFHAAAAAVFAVMCSAFAVRLRPMSARVASLTREFDGAPTVRIMASLYGLSPNLATQLAAAHGYHYRGMMTSFVHGPILLYGRDR